MLQTLRTVNPYSPSKFIWTAQMESHLVKSLRQFVYTDQNRESRFTYILKNYPVAVVKVISLAMALAATAVVEAFVCPFRNRKVYDVTHLATSLKVGSNSIPLNKNCCLEAKNGHLFPKIKFTSPKYPSFCNLLRELHFRLQDIDRAYFINEQYEKHLYPALTKKQDRSLIESWIMENALLLGSTNIEFYKNLLVNNEKLKHIFARCPQAALAVESFLKSLIIAEDIKGKENDAEDEIRIAITTTNSGGGHLSVARAIEGLFKQKSEEIFQRYGKRIKAEIINVNEHDQELDPLYQYTGKLPTEKVYDEVYQKQGNKKKAKFEWHKAEIVKDYIPDRRMGKVADKIRDMKPHFIISTRQYSALDVRFMHQFNVPGAFINCDYSNHDSIKPLAHSTDPHLVDFWLPNHSRNIVNEIDNKVFLRFNYSGYPVRMAFTQPASLQEVEQIRKKEGLLDGEKAVLLSMGRQGVGKDIPRLLNELKGYPHDAKDPIRVFIVCGKNEDLQAQVAEIAKGFDNHPKVKIVSLGFKGEKEMADLYKMTNLFVGKPGGASTAELLATGTPALLLYDDFFPVEKPNLKEAKEAGLAEEMDIHEEGKFVSSLLRCLQKPRPEAPPIINWQEKIPELALAGIKKYTSLK